MKNTITSFQIINEGESVKTECLTAVIFGEPGVGKTSVSMTTANPVLLDFDMGVQRSAVRKTAVRVDSWQGVQDLIESKDFEKLAPRTIIVDTAGTMLDNYIADYVKKDDPKNSRRGGELSLQGYGALKNVFKQFMDWAKGQKVNLIFIAHATEKRNGDDSQYVPKMTGGSYDILRESSDLIGYMYTSKYSRVIEFTPKADHIGKDCAEIGLVEIPHYTDESYSTFLQDLIDRTLEKMNAMSEEQAAVLEQIAEYRETVKSVTTADEANIQIDVLSEEPKSVGIQLFAILKKHCEDQGIEYDRKSKKFIENVSA